MGDIIPEEERFIKNAIIMAQALYEGIRRLNNAGYKSIDPNIINVVTTIISSFDKHYLIQCFIKNSHEKCWDNIKQRNETFFIENSNEIFKFLSVDKLNLFKDLFKAKDSKGNNIISDSLKNQMWNIFDAMIKISIKYIHKNRGPYSYINSNGEIINGYNKSFFDNVDITKHAKVWNVNLEFPKVSNV